MNPFDLSATALLIWGIVLHLIADWPLQNDWMAKKKALRAHLGMIPGDGMMTAPSRMHPYSIWFIRHPAAYVHAGIHGALLAIIFGWVAIPLAIAHLIIDCRWVVAKWSNLIGQTQPPSGPQHFKGWQVGDAYARPSVSGPIPYDVMYIGTEVRFWTDQVFHISCIALAAILVTL